jgi:hypothetical protein
MRITGEAFEFEVLAAARERAAALVARDPGRLVRVLHARLRWTTFDGQVLDRDGYVSANTGAGVRWVSQTLDEVEVQVVDGRVAVLTAIVTDVVGDGDVFRLRLTQTWVSGEDGWMCLAGHAGPRL